MKKKVLISHMRNENEEIEVSRYDTANTFAKFDSNLHSDEIHKAEKKKEDKEAIPDRCGDLEDEEEGIEHKNDISGELDGKENHENKNKYIPDFSKQEIQTAIDCLKRGKSGDTEGIRAEDLKESDDETRKTMRTVLNEIIKQESVIQKPGKRW